MNCPFFLTRLDLALPCQGRSVGVGLDVFMGLLAVAAKPRNKAGRPHRTQSRVRVTQALDRVREAARQSALLIRVPLGPRPWLRRLRSQDCSVGCCSVCRHGGVSARAEISKPRKSNRRRRQSAPMCPRPISPATVLGAARTVGEYQNLKSGKIDFDKGTITLPLYHVELHWTAIAKAFFY